MTSTDTQFGTTEHGAPEEPWFRVPRLPEMEVPGQPETEVPVHPETEAPGHPETEADADAWAPPGWYPDPPRLRYWTGRSWSSETRPAGPPPVVAAAQARHAKAPSPPLGEQVATPVTIGIAPEELARVEVPSLGRVPPLGEAFPVPEAPPLREQEPTAQVSVVEPEEPRERSVLHEMLMLLVVAVVALGAGALVAAIGIALTV